MNKKKIVIGTAQFGSDYGVHNQNGKVKYHQILKILNKGLENNINSIDTAIAYNGVHKILGNFNMNKWNIYTKIPSVPHGCKNVEEWIFNQINKSLDDLKVNFIAGIYIHNPMQLFEDNGNKIYKALEELKKNKKVKKIGYSVYSPKQLSNLWNLFKPDIVQLPYNIFDQRFANSGWLSKLKKNNITIHARSIFLQGLLFFSTDKLPNKFSQILPLFREYEDWLNDQKISKFDGSLAFAMNNEFIDNYVLGFDSYRQISDLVKFKVPKIHFPQFSSVIDEKILDPSRWNEL